LNVRKPPHKSHSTVASIDTRWSGQTDTKSPGSKFYLPHPVAGLPIVKSIQSRLLKVGSSPAKLDHDWHNRANR